MAGGSTNWTLCSIRINAIPALEDSFVLMHAGNMRVGLPIRKFSMELFFRWTLAVVANKP